MSDSYFVNHIPTVLFGGRILYKLSAGELAVYFPSNVMFTHSATLRVCRLTNRDKNTSPESVIRLQPERLSSRRLINDDNRDNPRSVMVWQYRSWSFRRLRIDDKREGAASASWQPDKLSSWRLGIDTNRSRLSPLILQ